MKFNSANSESDAYNRHYKLTSKEDNKLKSVVLGSWLKATIFCIVTSGFSAGTFILNSNFTSHCNKKLYTKSRGVKLASNRC